MKRRSGKGTVYRHRDAWRAQGPLQPDGERQELGTFPTREAALRALAAYDALTADRPVGLTLAAWGERWFRDLLSRGSVVRFHLGTLDLQAIRFVRFRRVCNRGATVSGPAPGSESTARRSFPPSS